MNEAQINDVQVDGGHVRVSLFIPANLHYFKGHFPGNPILPGVVQTGWAVLYGERFLSLPSEVERLEVVKFRNLILPESKVELSLQRNSNGKLVFKYMQDGEVMSSGRIVYKENQQDG